MKSLLSSFVLLVRLHSLRGFSLISVPSPLFSSRLQAASLASSTENVEYTVIDSDKATDQWELDCYSRPVLVGGKKLWEVLITDSEGSFRYRHVLPSNQVNSKSLREVVDDLMETAPVKPNVIRFFRGAMFNMVGLIFLILGRLVGHLSHCYLRSTLLLWIFQ